MGEKGAYSTMKFIELSQEQQRIVFTQASVQTGINVNLAEKDWWICQVLAALYKLPSAEHTSFKGGTSLSKCWKLIDRISEDIDIGIDREYLGFGGNLSKTQISDKLSALLVASSETSCNMNFMTHLLMKELQRECSRYM